MQGLAGGGGRGGMWGMDLHYYTRPPRGNRGQGGQGAPPAGAQGTRPAVAQGAPAQQNAQQKSLISIHLISQVLLRL